MRGSMSLPILFQDDDLIVINKPAGLLVHRSALDRHETRFALQLVRDQIGRRVFPVHRLDRPTAGALVFAFDTEAARLLAQSWTEVAKTYKAIVRGWPEFDSTTLDYPLREELDAIADAHARENKPAQGAVTHVRKLATCELPVAVDRYPTTRYALVEARPLTGRKHQVRRHLRHLGHPIIGDVNHGSGKHNRFFAHELASRRLHLACTELTLPHPRTGRPLTVRAPLDEGFRAVLTRLGWASHV